MERGSEDDVGRGAPPKDDDRWYWLVAQGRMLCVKLYSLSTEFRAIAEQLRGLRRDGSDDEISRE